jgi:hypothetical protein
MVRVETPKKMEKLLEDPNFREALRRALPGNEGFSVGDKTYEFVPMHDLRRHSSSNSTECDQSAPQERKEGSESVPKALVFPNLRELLGRALNSGKK